MPKHCLNYLNCFCVLGYKFASDQEIITTGNDYNPYVPEQEDNNGWQKGEFSDDETSTETEYSITDDERKRQNHINEFITSERAYVRDMEIVIDVSHIVTTLSLL